MPWYPRIQAAINATLTELLPTQATNLALLVSALLTKRTLCLSALARAYPQGVAGQRRVAQPKHDLLHRLKRLWRFLDNDRVDPLAVQVALIPATVRQLGTPRWLGLALDWTEFDTTLPTGQRRRYQVLRIAVPRRGRALPLVQVAYDRDALPAGRSQNQLEEAALLVVLQAMPAGVRPVVLADRGFARASFLAWLQEQGVDYVIRLTRRTCLTDADGRRVKLGTDDGVQPGQMQWWPQMRYGLHHDRPRALWIHAALCWRPPKHQARAKRHQQPDEPWYLATSLPDGARPAVAWYQQRWWIEESFKDVHSRFGLKHVQIGCPQRLTRLLAALTLALCWLTLLALPHLRALPDGWHAAVAAWGRPSLTSLALEYLDAFHDLPLAALPISP
jgi:DDE family transposase